MVHGTRRPLTPSRCSAATLPADRRTPATPGRYPPNRYGERCRERTRACHWHGPCYARALPPSPGHLPPHGLPLPPQGRCPSRTPACAGFLALSLLSSAFSPRSRRKRSWRPHPRAHSQGATSSRARNAQSLSTVTLNRRRRPVGRRDAPIREPCSREAEGCQRPLPKPASDYPETTHLPTVPRPATPPGTSPTRDLPTRRHPPRARLQGAPTHRHHAGRYTRSRAAARTPHDDVTLGQV